MKKIIFINYILLLSFFLLIDCIDIKKELLICTENESKLLASLFIHNDHINSFNKKKYDGSNCPTEGWFEVMRDSDIKRKNNGIFINIGFNKGYNFANWMNLYAPWTGVTPLLWFNYLQSKYNMEDSKEPCGICNDCHVTFKEYSEKVVIDNGDYIFIGMDINKENIDIVNNILETISTSTNTNNKFVSTYLIWGGGSDKKALINIPKCPPASETCFIPDSSENLTVAELKEKYHVDIDTIHAIPVDQLVEEVSLKYKSKHSIFSSIIDDYYNKENKDKNIRLEKNNHTLSKIDILMIDTEGHDDLVLRGSHHLLKHNAIRSIIFEYHYVGLWNNTKLEANIRDLDLYGYDCYFEGQDRLWYITRTCWNSLYEFHQWSNVICILKNDIWNIDIEPYIVTPKKINDFFESNPFKNGQIVRPIDQKSIYLIENNKHREFNSFDAFTRYGYDLSQVIVINGGIAELLTFTLPGDPIV